MKPFAFNAYKIILMLHNDFFSRKSNLFNPLKFFKRLKNLSNQYIQSSNKSWFFLQIVLLNCKSLFNLKEYTYSYIYLFEKIIFRQLGKCLIINKLTFCNYLYFNVLWKCKKFWFFYQKFNKYLFVMLILIYKLKFYRILW